MLVATSVFESLSADNPLVLLLAAGSLGLILAVLYQGGWKYVANVVVQLFVYAYWLALLWAAFVALGLFCVALFGDERSRAGSFIGAVILTAATLVINRVMTSENWFTRFLASLIISKEDSSN